MVKLTVYDLMKMTTNSLIDENHTSQQAMHIQHSITGGAAKSPTCSINGLSALQPYPLRNSQLRSRDVNLVAKYFYALANIEKNKGT